MNKGRKDKAGDEKISEGEIIPYAKPKDLAEFMNKPLRTIAEAVTGAISTDKSELLGSIGRITQGVISGKGVQQFARELRKFQEKGAIKEDYAEQTYGYQSLSELLNYIDKQAPDAERLRAVKAMFFKLVSTDSKPSDETLNYKLFQLSQQLSSTQIAILAAVYKVFLLHPKGGFNGGADAWLNDVAAAMGHGIKGLIESEEKTLEDNKLISPRVHSDRSGINPNNCRLTDLGIRFCEHLAHYDSSLNEKLL